MPVNACGAYTLTNDVIPNEPQVIVNSGAIMADLKYAGINIYIERIVAIVLGPGRIWITIVKLTPIVHYSNVKILSATDVEGTIGTYIQAVRACDGIPVGR